jgi:formylglycine-generating enzyme required for sulfatase activity
MKKSILFSVALLSAVAAYSADPSISDVTVMQRWPWNGAVDIYYSLTAEEACDVEVTATWAGQSAPVALNDISGDYVSVSSGNRHIVWDPAASGLPLPLSNFTVTLTPVSSASRKYLILNLKDGAVSYSSTEPDWQAHEEEYLGTNIVFRRISATTFNFGYPSSQMKEPYLYANNRNLQRNATLSSDYYMAIFPFTEAQWRILKGESITSNHHEYYRLPRGVAYDDARGTIAEGICWPDTFHEVTTNSLAGMMRKVASKSVPSEWKFDLPTAAQWENAARAGTDSTNLCYVEGAALSTSPSVMSNLMQNAGQWTPGVTETAHVGDYAPNQWGIYDTIGCVMEFVLDFRLPKGPCNTTAVTDPTGVSSNSVGGVLYRQVRGGRCSSDCSLMMLMPANGNQGLAQDSTRGARVCIHLKPITQISD